jgi:hypothetical protein
MYRVSSNKETDAMDIQAHEDAAGYAESDEDDRTDLPSASTAILVVVVGVAIILALLFLFQVMVVR